MSTIILLALLKNPQFPFNVAAFSVNDADCSSTNQETDWEAGDSGHAASIPALAQAHPSHETLISLSFFGFLIHNPPFLEKSL